MVGTLDAAQRERARVRRETWQVESLESPAPSSFGPLNERLERLERLRRIAFALAGVDYPEGPTPKHERERWPVERIG
jgi:hypothetical protein